VKAVTIVTARSCGGKAPTLACTPEGMDGAGGAHTVSATVHCGGSSTTDGSVGCGAMAGRTGRGAEASEE